jgi:hypothetical protein
MLFQVVHEKSVLGRMSWSCHGLILTIPAPTMTLDKKEDAEIGPGAGGNMTHTVEFPGTGDEQGGRHEGGGDGHA